MVLTKVEPVPATCRSVAVQRLGTLDLAIDLLVEAAAKGAACAFVRNSVDEAIAAVGALRERGIAASLHHARFAMCDRLKNEDAVMATFGKAGKGRSGSVIVGTQVLEQSLDIDFDVMVSDLAPIGALIQRAGRLWRHMGEHPADSRPVPGPMLLVLSPDPDDVADKHWADQLLGKSAFVYPVDILWLTAKALFAAGAIVAPSGLRDLIEAVEGESGTVVPPALKQAETDRLGQMGAERGQAKQNLLKPFGDYRDAGNVWKDEHFPTRLSPPQITLVLASHGPDGALIPYAEVEDGNTARAWAMSEVSVSRRRWEKSGGVDQTTPQIARIRKDWKAWKLEQYVIFPVSSEAVPSNTKYSRSVGLFLSK